MPWVWSSWSYDSAYMPEDTRTAVIFNLLRPSLTHPPPRGCPAEVAQRYVLLLGIFLRDCSMSDAAKARSTGRNPVEEQFLSSALSGNIAEDILVDALKALAEEEPSSQAPGSSVQEPAPKTRGGGGRVSACNHGRGRGRRGVPDAKGSGVSQKEESRSSSRGVDKAQPPASNPIPTLVKGPAATATRRSSRQRRVPRRDDE